MHREACAAAGIDAATRSHRVNTSSDVAAAPFFDAGTAATFEALHPWLPSRVSEDIELLLLNAAPDMTLGLRDFLRDPDGTVVIHVRLEDMYEFAYLNSIARSQSGLSAVCGSGKHDWLGPAFYQQRGGAAAVAAANPAELIEALEASAALAYEWSVPSLSYYCTVLRATRSVWRRVLVVGNSQLADSPIFKALQEEFGAVLQSGSEARDMAVLLLARQLIISGGSTFSYMAAAQGRARVIHAPHVGLMRLRSYVGGSLVTPSHFDARWVYHDIHRGAVTRVAAGFAAQAAVARSQGLTNTSVVSREWALNASFGIWKSHVEWRREPLASPLLELDSSCPVDDPDTLGARGLAIALGATSEPLPSHLVPLPRSSMPRYFLTYDELAAFYSHGPCSMYYFPGHKAGEPLNTEKPFPGHFARY